MSSNNSNEGERNVPAYRPDEPSDNPTTTDDISVTLSVPERVEVRMVEATALADYEMLFLFTSFFLVPLSDVPLPCCRQTNTREFPGQLFLASF
jgi:hypothetical protein